MSDRDWLDEMLDWFYEFRVLIAALVLIFLLLAFHGCEVRVSIDSRPSQGGSETAGPK